MCVRERKDVFYERQTEYVRMRIKAECIHERKTKSFCLCWKKELLHNWKEREYEKYLPNWGKFLNFGENVE